MSKITKESNETLFLISEEFIYLSSADKPFYHIRSGDQMNEKGFKAYCAKHFGSVVMVVADKDGKESEKRLNAGEIWGNPDFNIESRRVVRRIVMEPTSEPEEQGDPEVYNRWYVLKQTMVPPDLSATTDDIAPLLKHLMYIAGGDMIGVAYFLNWMAQLYKTPDIKIPTAILLYSKFGGVGKSILFKLFAAVFGRPMVGSCSGSALNKGFDDVVEHKRILVVNEMARSDRADGYEKFKNMISEEQVSFEGKGRAAREVANITHYIITTNNGDALPLMEKDRRVLVLRCMEDRQEDAYYRDLVAWIEGEGPALLAGVFSRWTFPKDWDPYSPVPQTEATREMQQESRGSLVILLDELIAEHRAPFDRDIGRVTDVSLQLETMFGGVLKGSKVNNRTLPAALERLGARGFKVNMEKNGILTTTRCWVWRNHDKWLAASGQEISEVLGSA